MNRWVTALAVAVSGGAVIAMSAAHAAAFTPIPSATTAVPASVTGSTAGVVLKGDQQQQQHRWEWAGYDKGQWQVFFVGPKASGVTNEQLRESAMLDVSRPNQATSAMKVVINPCPELFATCATQIAFIGPFISRLIGKAPDIAREYPGEEILDLLADVAASR